MKRIRWFIVLLLALFLFGCVKEPSRRPENTEKPLTEEKQPTEEQNPAEEKEPEEPEVINPQLQKDGMGEGFLTETSLETQVPCKVRVFREKKEDNSEDLIIEVDTGTKVLQKLLYGPASGIGEQLYLADLTGDGVQEIVLHHCAGGSGGAGSYISWIMKVTEENICIIWESDNLFDTGFRGGVADGYQLGVTHSVKNYELLFDAKEDHKKVCFDESGKGHSNYEFMFDSFYEFEPWDKNEDGVFEIYCKQYTSLRGHSDYVGSACSVWKWNNKTNNLEIIDAWFEPSTED